MAHSGVTVTLLSFFTFLGDLRLSPEEEETKMYHEAPPDSKVQVRVKLYRKTTNKCGKSQTACGYRAHGSFLQKLLL